MDAITITNRVKTSHMLPNRDVTRKRSIQHRLIQPFFHHEGTDEHEKMTGSPRMEMT